MRKYLVFFSFNILVLIGFYLLPDQLKIDTRFAFFTRFTESNDLFSLKPDDLQSTNVPFICYKQKYLTDFFNKNQLDAFKFADTIPFYKRVQKIVLSYSKNGGEGCGLYSDDLIKNIRWLHEDNGHGCCSDHSQVFLAMCLVNRIFPREVHHKSHTFVEYFDPNEGKWVWVDSQYCLMATDESGNFMGLNDIYHYMQQRKSVNWVFFGNENHAFYHKAISSEITNYFNPEEFEVLTMTLGNNVFAQDYYNKKMSFLPKEIRQALLLTVGIQPRYLMYDPKNCFRAYFERIRLVFTLSTLVILLIDILLIYRIFKK
jgi:hypothetical protein